MTRWGRLRWIPVLWGWLAACELLPAGTGGEPQLAQPPPPVPSPPRAAPLTATSAASGPGGSDFRPQAKLPEDRGPFHPSLMRVREDATVDVAAYADVQACIRCHEDAGAQWAASAHAHASFDNPWYRSSVDAVREGVGPDAARHCAGCHDPLPLLSGKLGRAIRPQDPIATAGITCLVCHSVERAAPDGNASLTLSAADVPIPAPGDAESLARHRKRVAMPALRSPDLCYSCHRGFLGPDTGNPHHLLGIDEPGAFFASAFAGSGAHSPEPVAEQGCVDCHMHAEAAAQGSPGARHPTSHGFAGGHTALAAQVGAGAPLARIRAQLRRAVRLDAPVLRHNGVPQLVTEPIRWQAGDEIALDVTVRNTGAGHAFPGGVKDTQETWIELVVKDGAGRTLARSGHNRPGSQDPHTFFLRALVVDHYGTAETRHNPPHFGTVAYDHTVPSLGARTVRYALTLGSDAVAPLRAEVRLHHRRHRAELRAAACAASRSSRGRAFAAAVRKRGQPVIDGCAPEPITLVAAAEVGLGQPAPPGSRPMGLRLYDHALGLSHNLQEQLEEARWSALRALDVLGNGEHERARAQALWLLGHLAARTGRTEEAVRYAAEAETQMGPHPALERVRADAYLQVWRFAEAAGALERLVQHAPVDTAAHRDLARARFSVQDHRGALHAARAGLALQPRDEGLLRIQALALGALGAPDAKAAHATYLRYREADVTMSSKIACDRASATCARDRLPVVTIALAP